MGGKGSGRPSDPNPVRAIVKKATKALEDCRNPFTLYVNEDCRYEQGGGHDTEKHDWAFSVRQATAGPTEDFTKLDPKKGKAAHDYHTGNKAWGQFGPATRDWLEAVATPGYAKALAKSDLLRPYTLMSEMFQDGIKKEVAIDEVDPDTGKVTVKGFSIEEDLTYAVAHKARKQE